MAHRLPHKMWLSLAFCWAQVNLKSDSSVEWMPIPAALDETKCWDKCTRSKMASPSWFIEITAKSIECSSTETARPGHQYAQPFNANSSNEIHHRHASSSQTELFRVARAHRRFVGKVNAKHVFQRKYWILWIVAFDSNLYSFSLLSLWLWTCGCLVHGVGWIGYLSPFVCFLLLFLLPIFRCHFGCRMRAHHMVSSLTRLPHYANRLWSFECRL